MKLFGFFQALTACLPRAFLTQTGDVLVDIEEAIDGRSDGSSIPSQAVLSSADENGVPKLSIPPLSAPAPSPAPPFVKTAEEQRGGGGGSDVGGGKGSRQRQASDAAFLRLGPWNVFPFLMRRNLSQVQFQLLWPCVRKTSLKPEMDVFGSQNRFATLIDPTVIIFRLPFLDIVFGTAPPGNEGPVSG